MATEQTQKQQEPAIQSTMSAAPKQLAATDITSKIATGTPLMQKEKLPDVPEGMSAKGFYGQFPGGASVYSQAPFAQSSFEKSTPSTPVSTSKPEEPTLFTPPPPILDTFVIEDEGDSQEPSLELADTPDVSNQMDDLLGKPDLGYSFEFDPNLSFVEDLSKNFEEFSVSALEDTGLDNLDVTLSNLGSRIGTAYNEGIAELKQETNEVLTDIEDFIDKGLEAHITDAMSYVQNSFQELADNLSNLTNPNKAMEAIEYFGSAFEKTIASNIIGKSLSAAGLGVLGGPIGMGIVSLVSAGSQIGVVGMSYGGKDPYEGSVNGTGTPATIAGYNSLGIAVDKTGSPVFSYDPISHSWTNYQFDKPSRFGSTFTDKDIEDAKDYFSKNTYVDEETGEAMQDISDIDDPLGHGPTAGLTGYGATGAAEDAAEDPAEAPTEAPAEDPPVNAEDMGLEDPAEDMGLNAGAAAELGAGSPDGGEGGGDTDSSGPGDGDPKIICTMMNRMYGLGEYRIKQWLLYSDRYLTPEHELGYHKLYCKLVSMMPSNKLLAKILSHIANKRTDDIVAEMKGTKRSLLGRIYRATLIDTPSYVVGVMIKRNWLQPADISILSKGSILWLK